MYCRLCENLERALEARCREFIEASSNASYSICKDLAAYRNVEMERARAELHEHRMVCLAATNTSQPLPAASMLRRAKPEARRIGQASTAA